MTMYYHISSELGVEVSHRLQLQGNRIIKNNNKLDNCGKMSIHDSVIDFPLTERRVVTYIDTLIGKEGLVSTQVIADVLNIPKDTIEYILAKNGFELTTATEEEE